MEVSPIICFGTPCGSLTFGRSRNCTFVGVIPASILSSYMYKLFVGSFGKPFHYEGFWDPPPLRVVDLWYLTVFTSVGVEFRYHSVCAPLPFSMLGHAVVEWVTRLKVCGAMVEWVGEFFNNWVER